MTVKKFAYRVTRSSYQEEPTVDELLHDRVEQLRKIDEEIEQIGFVVRDAGSRDQVLHRINLLRFEIVQMIRKAEADHAAF